MARGCSQLVTGVEALATWLHIDAAVLALPRCTTPAPRCSACWAVRATASPTSAVSAGSCTGRARIARGRRSRPGRCTGDTPEARPRLEVPDRPAVEPGREIHLHLNVTLDQLAVVLRHAIEEK
jgi:hypothetical protein